MTSKRTLEQRLDTLESEFYSRESLAEAWREALSPDEEDTE